MGPRALLIGVVAAALLGVGGVPAQSACTPAWHVVAHRGVPALWGVAAAAPDDVWAIGGPESGNPRLVHWDGHAVHTQVLHWPTAVLTSISARGKDDAWAVGFSGAMQAPLAVHWDGTRWLLQALPLATGWLADVAIVAPGDVWAVGGAGGHPLLLHRDIRRWHAVVLPALGQLLTVSARSPRDVWAAGRDTAGHDLLLHFDGERWRRAASPRTVGDAYAEASTLAPSGRLWTLDADDAGEAAWLVGRGSVTSAFSPAVGSDTSLYDIAATSTWSGWVVGARGDAPLVARWDGLTLHTLPAFSALRGADLAALAVVSPADVWAAGDHLVARYSCAARNAS